MPASKEEARISEVLVYLPIIKTQLSILYDGDEALRNLIDNIRTNIHKRFDKIKNDENYIVATILDPRHKHNFLTHDQFLLGKAAVLKFAENDPLINHFKDYYQIEIHDKFGTLNLKKPKLNNVERIYDDMVKLTETQKENSLDNEINNYILDAKMVRNYDPLKYGEKKCGLLPMLASISLRFLNVPIAILDSEKVFSLGGNFCTNKRCNLSQKKIEMLTFLNKLKI